MRSITDQAMPEAHAISSSELLINGTELSASRTLDSDKLNKTQRNMSVETYNDKIDSFIGDLNFLPSSVLGTIEEPIFPTTPGLDTTKKQFFQTPYSLGTAEQQILSSTSGVRSTEVVKLLSTRSSNTRLDRLDNIQEERISNILEELDAQNDVLPLEPLHIEVLDAQNEAFSFPIQPTCISDSPTAVDVQCKIIENLNETYPDVEITRAIRNLRSLPRIVYPKVASVPRKKKPKFDLETAIADNYLEAEAIVNGVDIENISDEQIEAVECIQNHSDDWHNMIQVCLFNLILM